jgi:hypothetical protein
LPTEFPGSRDGKIAECQDVEETKGDSRARRKFSRMYHNETKRVNRCPSGPVGDGICIWKMKVYPYGSLKTKEIEKGLAKILCYP